jgi:hypothetical protein
MKPLLDVDEFAAGAAGHGATTSQDYIYHLTPIRKVLRYNDWTYFPSGFPTVKHEDRRLFEYLLDDYYRQGKLLDLGNYARGDYNGFRGFTWWTSLDLLNTQIVCAGHRLGLPNKWIPKYALIMRCSARYAMSYGIPRVPTVVDGFVSEIFQPADLLKIPTPPSGTTINLDGPGPLTDGEEEFVLSKVDVGAIKFKPVLIDRSLRNQHRVVRNARLWQLLEMFYDSL